MSLPSIDELTKKYGMRLPYSIQYGARRALLDYTEAPLAAYGVGYGAIVCVIHTQKNLNIAYRVFNSYRGAEEVQLEYALEEIRNNKLLVHTAIDDELIKKGRSKFRKFKRPLLGECTVVIKSYRLEDEKEVHTYDDTYSYSFYGLKYGGIHVQGRWGYSSEISYVATNLRKALEGKIEIRRFSHGQAHRHKYTISKGRNVAEKMLTEIDKILLKKEL